MDLGLSGRRAAVGASTSGLGLACAEALAAEGARVAVCGREADRARRAAAGLGPGAVGLAADLSDPHSATAFVDEAADALGGLDILVANGPGPAPGTLGELSPSDFPPALATSLLSVVAMCYAALPRMRVAGWGRIVAVTSIAVRQPIPNLALSNTARAGATGYLKTLAREIAGEGVTVNSVLPGLHATPRVEAVFGDDLARAASGVPAGELGRPADLGATVAFLCSEQARYLTGVALPVDGGMDAHLL
ncbi:MAG: SDR family oxidoreductase [Pseudonocardiaceae bacterium]|nr:SDR family oxidoreductase [Pseudonocardiaceae bacterium]